MLGESAIYGLGGIANQALAIILVPIYARQLGVESYGAVAIINTTLSLTAMVVTLALPQAFFRSYLKESESGRERAAVLLRYGAHLSPMLVDLVRGLVPSTVDGGRVKESFDELFADDDESPYHESPYLD